MRQLIWALVLIPLVWSGWWFAAATSLTGSIADWFAARRLDGWQADFADLTRGGFPANLRVALIAPALADPATGVAVEASRLDLAAPAWWPGHVTLLLPSDPIHLANPQGRSALTAQAARAELRLHPGTALQLERLALTSGPWRLDAPRGSQLAADTLDLAAEQDVTDLAAYALSLDATALAPGDLLRAALFIPDDWPVAFDRFTARAQVQFDHPWDIHAIEQARPQPRRINLTLAEAVWGDLRLKAAGLLEIDAVGVPTGTMSLQAQNWRDMLTLAETAGYLRPDMRPQVESVISALAGMGGNPDALDLTLTFRGGFIAVGFIPIGPAPRLILR